MIPLIRILVAAMTIASALGPSPAAAQVSPTPCAEPLRRQFDFWLGTWEVTNPAGKVVGHSRIESILDGCALQENWQSTSGVSGRSLNIYNADKRLWEQFWVDNSGARLHLSGGLDEGEMVLRSDQNSADAQPSATQQERVTWTPNADGSVRQFWETSQDGGRTWSASFDGLYRRSQEKNQE